MRNSGRKSYSEEQFFDKNLNTQKTGGQFGSSLWLHKDLCFIIYETSYFDIGSKKMD